MTQSLQAALIQARQKRGMCTCSAGCADNPYADSGYWRGQWCGCWCHLARYEEMAARVPAVAAA